MALFVSESNISAAWVAGLAKLVEAGGEAVNLTVAIADPVTEIDGVRAILDEFVAARRARNRKSVEKVSTVANTLFPQSWYRESLGDAAASHVYELEQETRHVSHRTAKRGTYFERLGRVARPREGAGQSIGAGDRAPAVGPRERRGTGQSVRGRRHRDRWKMASQRPS